MCGRHVAAFVFVRATGPRGEECSDMPGQLVLVDFVEVMGDRRVALVIGDSVLDDLVYAIPASQARIQCGHLFGDSRLIRGRDTGGENQAAERKRLFDFARHFVVSPIELAWKLRPFAAAFMKK